MGPPDAGFILSQQGAISLDQEIVIGGKYFAGTVLAKKGNGEFTKLNLDATDTTKVAVNILYGKVDATTATKKTVIARLSEVEGQKLIWPDGITPEQQATAISELAGNFIIVR